MPVYLDFNASAPIRPEVLDTMWQVYHHTPGNAASPHEFGRQAAERADAARRAIAAPFGCKPRDVVFTAGATESNNLAILGLEAEGRAANRLHVVCTAIEHASVLEPCRALQAHGFEVTFVQPNEDGVVPAQAVLDAVRPDTLLVCMMHANNETGVLQPVEQVADGLQALAAQPALGHSLHTPHTPAGYAGVRLHVDCAQSLGKVANMPQNCYTVAVSAHKIGGPQGIGGLVFPRGRDRALQPVVYGGMQEWGLRPGTLPVALVAGFGRAVEAALADLPGQTAAMAATGQHLLQQFAVLPHRVHGQAAERLPNTLYVHFAQVPADQLTRLASGACAVSSGAACATLEHHPSHVLLAMGVPQEQALTSLRFSWGAQTGTPDLGPFVAQLQQAAR